MSELAVDPTADLSSALRGLTLAVRDTQTAINKLYNGIETGSIGVAEQAMTGEEVDVQHIETFTAPLVVNDAVSDTTEPHRWYAIIVGRQPGVFCGSVHVTSNVQRIPGSHVVKCDSEEQCWEVFHKALLAGQVEKVAMIVTRTVLGIQDFPAL